ncbi:MAG: VOC family protein [Spirochaetes bacterium]|nr:VOC family protein [Spirochaetota bacterium]
MAAKKAPAKKTKPSAKVPPPPPFQLAHFGICVRDLDATVKWYRKHLGFTEVKRFERAELEIQGALLSLPGGFIEVLSPLHPAMAAREGLLVHQLQKLGANHFAVAVDDVKAAFRRMKALPLPYQSELVDGRFFFCKDPEGTLIEIKQA